MARYQTGWPRFVAFWIDAFIVSTLQGVMAWLANLNMGILLNVIVAVVYASIHVVYPVYMHGRFGQTLGKFFTKVKVVGLDGYRISYEQAFLRDILPCMLLPVSLWLSLYVVITGEQPNPAIYRAGSSVVVMWFLLELATMLLNEQRRAVHDFIARTVVIRVP